MKSKEQFEQELLFKELRIAYWEKFNIVPTMSDILSMEVKI